MLFLTLMRFILLKDSLLTKEEINVVKVNEKTLYFNGLEENTELVVEPLNKRSGTNKSKNY